MNYKDKRKQLGYEIAQHKQIKITKDGWLVESQSGNATALIQNFIKKLANMLSQLGII
jgi:hypothetical protein